MQSEPPSERGGLLFLVQISMEDHLPCLLMADGQPAVEINGYALNLNRTRSANCRRNRFKNCVPLKSTSDRNPLKSDYQIFYQMIRPLGVSIRSGPKRSPVTPRRRSVSGAKGQVVLPSSLRQQIPHFCSGSLTRVGCIICF